MKDVIVGCTDGYKWDHLKYWVNSINMSGFDGDKVLIVFNSDAETLRKVVESGFQVISPGTRNADGSLSYKPKTAVHVERFIHIYNYLKNNPDIDRVIATDVRDVIFQHNPFDYMNEIDDKYSMVFASESIQYKNEPWGDNNLLETYGAYVHEIFRENEIYNVGVLMGYKDDIESLALNIFMNAINRPIAICDQAVFNFMISQPPYLYDNLYLGSESGWACMLGTTADPNKIETFQHHLLEESPIFKDGKVCTSKGKEFFVVHQYDRVPEWKNIIEEKYA